MSAAATSALLRAQLERSTDPEALRAFANIEGALVRAPTQSALLTGFSAAARSLGKDALSTNTSAVQGPEDLVPLSAFSCDVAGRALLLLRYAELDPAALEAGVWAAYREGDTLEKLAVVRSLSLLPAAARFLPLALDAGRTSDARLFAALASDNPFPARHYPELEWNKLVMKAAFVRAPLERILGLDRRENPELARMALEYVEERESAGRSFPPEIWRAIAPFPRPGVVAKLLGYATHANPILRLEAVRGLARVHQARTASFLRERQTIETDDGIRAALDALLAALPQEP